MKKSTEHTLAAFAQAPQILALRVSNLLDVVCAIRSHFSSHDGKLWQRYFWKSLIRPVSAHQWANKVLHRDEFAGWVTPRLFLKPTRHYYNRRLSSSERMACIQAHYQLVQQCFQLTVLTDLKQGKSVPMMKLVGKEGSSLCLELARTDRFDREGELILSLKSSAGDRTIFSAVFFLSNHRGISSIEIGCLQGSNNLSARESIRAATRLCYGIRPKNLLLEVLFALASAWRIGGIFGISNRARVFNGSQTHADYDAFWKELQGMPLGDGTYRLPESLRHREISEVTSHKRAQHRRQLALRETMQEFLVRRWCFASHFNIQNISEVSADESVN